MAALSGSSTGSSGMGVFHGIPGAKGRPPVGLNGETQVDGGSTGRAKEVVVDPSLGGVATGGVEPGGERRAEVVVTEEGAALVVADGGGPGLEELVVSPRADGLEPGRNREESGARSARSVWRTGSGRSTAKWANMRPRAVASSANRRPRRLVVLDRCPDRTSCRPSEFRGPQELAPITRMPGHARN
jgi:hypothetical protein